MEHETFWTLFFDASHWEFELFLMFIFDVVLGLLVWPWVRQAFIHHEGDDDKLAALERKVKALQDKLGIKDDDET